MAKLNGLNCALVKNSVKQHPRGIYVKHKHNENNKNNMNGKNYTTYVHSVDVRLTREYKECFFRQ